MISFLSAARVAELTGYQRAYAQRSWLKANDYPFDMGGDGVPKVLESVVLERLGGSQQKKKGPQLRLSG